MDHGKDRNSEACGDTDIGGAYVGKDGYDFEKITPEDVDEKQVDRNIKAVEDYFMTASETIDKQKLSFLLVPTSGLVMQEKLPKTRGFLTRQNTLIRYKRR